MKNKKIVCISHCIINQNSVVDGLERAVGAFPIANLLLEKGVGVIQLPCPELLFNGIRRQPMRHEQYNNEDYRMHCKHLLKPYIEQIRQYLYNEYTLLGIIGIQGSPTCSITGKRGILMEELFCMCSNEGISLKYAEIPESYNEAVKDSVLEKQILNLLEGK